MTEWLFSLPATSPWVTVVLVVIAVVALVATFPRKG